MHLSWRQKENNFTAISLGSKNREFLVKTILLPLFFDMQAIFLPI